MTPETKSEPFDESPQKGQATVKLYHTGETNHFVKYESEQEETFKSKKGIVAKLWIAKKEFLVRDEDGRVITGVCYPSEITIQIG